MTRLSPGYEPGDRGERQNQRHQGVGTSNHKSPAAIAGTETKGWLQAARRDTFDPRVSLRSREAEAEGPQVSLLDPAESEFLSESKLAREHAGH